MNALAHEQAIRLLHEAAQHLSVDQQAGLAAHLAECEHCRVYADRINTLQPLLTQALRTRRYAHVSESAETAQAYPPDQTEVIDA